MRERSQKCIRSTLLCYWELPCFGLDPLEIDCFLNLQHLGCLSLWFDLLQHLNVW